MGVEADAAVSPGLIYLGSYSALIPTNTTHKTRNIPSSSRLCVTISGLPCISISSTVTEPLGFLAIKDYWPDVYSGLVPEIAQAVDAV